MKEYKEDLSIHVKMGKATSFSFLLAIPTVFKFVFLAVLLFFSCIAAICLGSVDIPIKEVLATLLPFATPADSVYEIILNQVRFPRVLAAIFAGTGLSITGLILQTLLNNSLAAPNLIGINSGASLGVILLFTLLPSHYSFAPAAAFMGAFFVCLILAVFTQITNATKTNLVLVGIALSSLLNSFCYVLLLQNPIISMDSSSFMLGSLSGVKFKHLVIPLIFLLISFLLVSLFSGYLNTLTLGETLASALGMKVSRIRFFFFLLCAFMVGSIVSFAGLLGFVGLIVPHIARRFIGGNMKILLPFTAMLGAFFVVFADLIGRMIISPYELPAGVIMSILGCPYFIYLILKQKGGNAHAEI